jgi:hypothetical protein
MAISEISSPWPPKLASIPAERAFVNADCWLTATAKHNANDIEAAWRWPINGQSAQILPGDGANMFPFVRVNGGRWRRKVCARPGFHFDKAKNPVVPPDKVNLTPVVGDAEICRHNPVVQGTQVEVRFDFTLFAGQQMPWFSRSKAYASEFQTADDELGQPDHSERRKR